MMTSRRTRKLVSDWEEEGSSQRAVQKGDGSVLAGVNVPLSLRRTRPSWWTCFTALEWSESRARR